MPERQHLLTLSTISDDDTGMYTLGEVDGVFINQRLFIHINRYGATGLKNHLCYLISQVQQMESKINNESNSAVMAAAKDVESCGRNEP